jgi:hypothetical protein
MARSTGASARALRIPEHRRLQRHAHHFGGGAETAGDVAGALIAGEVILVGRGPAFGQAAGHAHRHQHFGVAPAGDGEIVAPRRQHQRLARRLAGQYFGKDGESDQKDRADQGGQAEHDMERKADRQIQRQPRQVEQRAWPDAGQERPDIVEVPQRLQAFATAAGDQRQANHGLEHPS